MQIRIGNKQDEPKVRDLVLRIMGEHGFDFDLEKECDLKNIEKEYIWHDGIFLVAEEQGKIVGFAAARSSNDDVCQLKRFFVEKAFQGQHISNELLSIITKFAGDMDYSSLEFVMAPECLFMQQTLSELNFLKSDQSLKPDIYRKMLSRLH